MWPLATLRLGNSRQDCNTRLFSAMAVAVPAMGFAELNVNAAQQSRVLESCGPMQCLMTNSNIKAAITAMTRDQEQSYTHCEHDKGWGQMCA